MTAAFMIALRGFDMKQVDQLLQQAYRALASNDEAVRAAALRSPYDVQLKRRLRGYARAEVEQAIREHVEKLTRSSEG